MAARKLHIRLLCAASYIVANKFYKDDYKSISTVIENTNKQLKPNEKTMISILVASEDKRFYSHCGFDIYAIVRAACFNLLKRQRSGASTIDQQLVRTITQNKERTISRKIKEIILASAINRNYNKTRIANAYLENAYYGWNMNGLTRAKSRLTTEELLFNNDTIYALVSMLKYPLPKTLPMAALTRINRRINYAKWRITILQTLGWSLYEEEL